MKKITTIIACSILLSFSIAFSQSKDKSTILKIGDNKISIDEFERIFNKNKNTAINEDKSKEEYLDLFINYKLKVIEAKSLGYDTAKTFVEELGKYKDQLAKPYIRKNEYEEKFLKEAYEHKKYLIKPYTILAKFNQIDSPDTIEAYNNILKVQNRLSDGETFDDLVEEYSKNREGMISAVKLNWITAFDLTYDFEVVAFNLPVNQISTPVKSPYGYHLIKIMDKMPNPGSARVAHIMTMLDKNANDSINKIARKKIYEYYNMLKNGANFNELVGMYSEHVSSAVQGGELKRIRPGNSPKAIEEAVFSLKNVGDFSEPVKTLFGWHIIKLLEKDTIGTYEMDKDRLLAEMENNKTRNEMLEKEKIKRLMSDYNFVEYITSNDTIFNICSGNCKSLADDFSNYSDLNGLLFTINNKKAYTQYDFIKYFGKLAPGKLMRVDQNSIMKEYQNFIKAMLQKYEKDYLEEINPEFRNLMQEYREGILLFNLTSDSVWNKAVEDTAGLENYYKKNKSNYMWNKRWYATKYSVKDSSLLLKAKELAILRSKEEISKDQFIEELCGNDSIPCITIKDIKTEENTELLFKKAPYKVGMTDVYFENNEFHFISVNKELPPENRKLEEARGLVISDYQTYLENKWIERLKNKYDIEINNKLLKKVK